jgi:hypothetical protein
VATKTALLRPAIRFVLSLLLSLRSVAAVLLLPPLSVKLQLMKAAVLLSSGVVRMDEA